MTGTRMAYPSTNPAGNSRGAARWKPGTTDAHHDPPQPPETARGRPEARCRSRNHRRVRNSRSVTAAQGSRRQAGSARYGYQIAAATADVVCGGRSRAHIRTEWPAWASRSADDRPDTPAPITTMRMELRLETLTSDQHVASFVRPVASRGPPHRRSEPYLDVPIGSLRGCDGGFSTILITPRGGSHDESFSCAPSPQP